MSWSSAAPTTPGPIAATSAHEWPSFCSTPSRWASASRCWGRRTNDRSKRSEAVARTVLLRPVQAVGKAAAHDPFLVGGRQEVHVPGEQFHAVAVAARRALEHRRRVGGLLHHRAEFFS